MIKIEMMLSLNKSVIKENNISEIGGIGMTIYLGLWECNLM
jgi:hypothetical protein